MDFKVTVTHDGREYLRLRKKLGIEALEAEADQSTRNSLVPSQRA